MDIARSGTPFTVDVESMYPNIPWSKSAFVLAEVWTRWREHSFADHPVSGEVVRSAAMLVLSSSMFSFGDQVFMQCSGTAMGSHMAVVLANCCMSALSKDFLSQHPLLHQSLPFFRRFLEISLDLG